VVIFEFCKVVYKQLKSGTRYIDTFLVIPAVKVLLILLKSGVLLLLGHCHFYDASYLEHEFQFPL